MKEVIWQHRLSQISFFGRSTFDCGKTPFFLQVGGTWFVARLTPLKLIFGGLDMLHHLYPIIIGQPAQPIIERAKNEMFCISLKFIWCERVFSLRLVN